MQEEQNRILDLKEEGYSWTQIANRLGYPSVDSVRGRVRKTQRYKEMMAKKKEQTVLKSTKEDIGILIQNLIISLNIVLYLLFLRQ